MRPFVVYWNNIPSPYMVERFNALADSGNVDFEAWFNDRIESDRSWNVEESSWRFRYRYLPVNKIIGRRIHWPLPIFGRRPDVLVSLYADPVFLVGWFIAKLRGTKTAFWVVLTFDSWIQRTSLRETLKKWLFHRAGAIVTTGNDGKGFAEKYGARSDRIIFAPHVIDVLHFQKGTDNAIPCRIALRERHGLKGVTFIYVGRLWLGKGLEYLMDAFVRAQSGFNGEMSLLLVGDGADESMLRRQVDEKGIRNVVFAGFRQKSELPRYYAMADVFVFPTLGDPYGLVVDEAMACSLPVISTSAAGEIRERVEADVNGYIVPPEDSETMADRMLILANNTELREAMGKQSFEKIKNNTPEKWAKNFEKIVFRLVGPR